MRSESEISEAVLGYSEVDDAVRTVIRTDLLPVREYLYSYQFCFIVRLEEKQTLFAEAPTEQGFAGICSEFWWVMKTFAEYTLREELPSAMFYLNVSVRDLLNKMLRWHIYLCSGKPADMGILDCNMEKLLEVELFELYKKIYPDAEYKHIWNALEAVSELWRKVGVSVAESCGFNYPYNTERDMLAFITRLKEIGGK